MKTKNMRKKALVSSIAMLLVAVIALGGATYAWFSTNQTATATGVSLKSGEQTSLLFGASTADKDVIDDWSSNYDLSTTQLTVVPVSSIDGSTFKKATIQSGTSELSTVITALDNAQGGTDYFTESFKAKSSTAAYLKLTGITFGTGAVQELKDNIRISIKVGETTPKLFYLSANAPTNVAVNTKSDETYAGTSTFADFYSASTEITGIQKTTPTFATPNTASAIFNEAGAAFTANGVQPITINIWLEGNDSTTNNAMMNKAIDGLTFSFATEGIAAGG